MKRTSLFLPACLALLCLPLLDCDDTINPMIASGPKMVVYSILTNLSDTQYVRIERTFNSPEDTSLRTEDLSVTDALATITDGNQTWTLRDTIIHQLGDTALPSAHVYYVYPMRVEPLTSYTINVTSPTYGIATAKATVPGDGRIEVFLPDLLKYPAEHLGKTLYGSFSISGSAKAYYVRFFILYQSDNGWEPEAIRNKEKSYEVPLQRDVLVRATGECRIYYPDPIPRITARALSYGFQYVFPSYYESVWHITHYNFAARFKRAVFYLIQFDEPLYKYYQNARLYRERLSVRLGGPDYTNITGGVGVFATVRVDSFVVDLPEYIDLTPPQGSYLPMDCVE